MLVFSSIKKGLGWQEPRVESVLTCWSSAPCVTCDCCPLGCLLTFIQLCVVTVHSTRMFTRFWRPSQCSQGKIHQDHSGWDPLGHQAGYSHSDLPAVAGDTLWVRTSPFQPSCLGLRGLSSDQLCIPSRCLWPPSVHWQRYGGAWKVGGVWPSDHRPVGGGAFAVFHYVHPQGEQHGGVQEDRLVLKVEAVHDTTRGENG